MLGFLMMSMALAAPVTLQHQGRALDSAGGPLNQSGSVTVGLYLNPGDDTPEWSQMQPVTFSDGYYAVTLGSDDSLDSSLFDGRTLYLGLTLGGVELTERQAIATVPYAVHSVAADETSSVVGRVQVRTDQLTCSSPEDDGLLRLDGEDLLVCAADAWRSLTNSPVGTADNPAASCDAVRVQRPGAQDGVYWLQTSAGPFQAYCDIAGGGWTLVLMTQSNDITTFRYDSSQWSATTALNATVLDPSVDSNMRSLAYASLPVTQVRLDLISLDNSIIETVSADSARALFTGSYRASSTSRAQYLDWLTDVPNSNWDNQPHCNQRGFQPSVTAANCRYGIIMNNENDCGTSDSAIGFGCHTNSYATSRVTSSGGHRWSPDVAYPRRGWIWVR